jgi:hypothetical protein
MVLSQIAFARGACGGLARILMPSVVNTVSKELVNWPARSLIRNLTVATRWPRSITRLRAACVAREPSGFAVIPARWARRVLCSMTISVLWNAPSSQSTESKLHGNPRR